MDEEANYASRDSAAIAAMMLRAASIAKHGSIEERSRSRKCWENKERLQILSNIIEITFLRLGKSS